MEALLWRDYLCPWCWLGRDRSAVFRRLGVDVIDLPYELHPEIPAEGRAVRPGSRLSLVFGRIGDECRRAGVAFRAPTHSPNTHRALETAEIVRRTHPEVFPAVDEAFFRAHWVDGLDLGDASVLDRLAADAGAPMDEIAGRRAEGDGARALAESMAQAREHGVTATPAWLVDDALVIPGVQPVETLERWLGRLVERRSPHRVIPGEVVTDDTGRTAPH
jgi:predicted DsbA family dithiol-disulfide isomerase